MDSPLLALGHVSAYLQLANKLAKRGHIISFLIPKQTKAKVEHYNLYPLITFILITVPHVDGLPLDAETTFDVPLSSATLVMAAMDRTEKDVEMLLHELQHNVVFFDYTCWMPSSARSLGIKSLQYSIVNMTSVAHIDSLYLGNNVPPSGFPDSSIKLHAHEVRGLASFMKIEVGGVRLIDRMTMGTRLSDAMGYRDCRDIEGPYADFVKSFYGKPLLLTGPLLPEPPTSTLDQKWVQWLAPFKPSWVIYCAFGSEWMLDHNQFKELLLDLFELTGFPFLSALKAPIGFESVEEGMLEGFIERTRGRGGRLTQLGLTKKQITRLGLHGNKLQKWGVKG